jgi:hypothetical protein
MVEKRDELSSKLDKTDINKSGRKTLKVDMEFGDRPEVLESILNARRDRGLSFRLIAEVLSEDLGDPISSTAVQSWCRRRGVS